MKRLSNRDFFAFLQSRGLVFATAESCTGGLIATEVTSLPGASSVFWGGWVTYADAAKSELLGVPSALVRANGAVSGPVALEMAKGAFRISGVDFALAVTGVAGPGGGSLEKPVGTVWFGVAGRWRSYAVSRRFSGSRERIRHDSAGFGRFLAVQWWKAQGELDTEGFLADNGCIPFIEPFPPSDGTN